MSSSLDVFFKKSNKFEHVKLVDVFGLSLQEVLSNPFVFRFGQDYFVTRLVCNDVLLEGKTKISLDTLISSWVAPLNDFVVTNKYMLNFYEIYNLLFVEQLMKGEENVSLQKEGFNLVFGVRQRKTKRS